METNFTSSQWPPRSVQRHRTRRHRLHDDQEDGRDSAASWVEHRLRRHRRLLDESRTPNGESQTGPNTRRRPRNPTTPRWDLPEREWFITELQYPKGIFKRRNDRPCNKELEYFVNTLDIPLEEVKREIERLKEAYRTVAREKGVAQPWARQ